MFQVSITDQSWPLLAPLPPPANSQNIICNNKPLLLAKYLRGSDEACKSQREEPSLGLMLSTQTVIKQFYNSTVTCPPIFTTCLQTSKTVFYILHVKQTKSINKKQHFFLQGHISLDCKSPYLRVDCLQSKIFDWLCRQVHRQNLFNIIIIWNSQCWCSQLLWTLVHESVSVWGRESWRYLKPNGFLPDSD